MKSNIVKEVDVQKVAEFLVNQEKKKLMRDQEQKCEKSDDIQSLELLLGMKIIALWAENPDGKSWNNAKLNIRCLQEVKVDGGRADVEMTMVWELKELRDLKALDFVPEGSKQ
jgi:hypothetical protein